MLLGTHPGDLGETCALTLLLGGLFLIVTRVISPIIPCVYVGGVFVLKFGLEMLLPGMSIQMAAMQALAGMLQGGLLLGAFFMATDYVTSPMNPKGMVLFGVGIGLLTVIIRVFGSYPEGISFAILIMNATVPLINKYVKPKRYSPN